MSTPRFILTINGGGTKTTAAFWTKAGHLLSRAHGGPCNLFTDQQAGIAVVDQLWRELSGVVGLDPRAGRAEVAVSLTVAGAGLAPARRDCQQALSDFQRCLISSDAYGALIGAFGGGPGAILVAGTGVSGCRLDAHGTVETLGGWGLRAGDRGGGAWLGVQLVADYLQFKDQIPPRVESSLWDMVEQVVGSERPEILEWLTTATPADFGQWAPAILDAAMAGDPEGLDLVQAASEELRKLANRLTGDPPLHLQITGSLGRALRPWLELDESDARASPHRGALLIGTGDVAPEFET